MSSRAKKKKLKRMAKQSALENIFTPDYVHFESPFKNMPQNVINDVMKLVEEKNDEEFHLSLEELRKNLRKFDVVDLTTWFTYYTLAGFIPSNCEVMKENKIQQFHIELLQALLLQNDYSDNSFGWKPVLPGDVSKIEKLLLKVVESYNLRKLKELVKYEDEEERKKALFIEDMRNHTMVVRNWGYPEQVIRITKNVFSKIDDEIKKVLGISAVGLIEMFERIVRKIEERQNLHIAKVREFYKCNDKSEIIKTYKKNWSNVKSTYEDLMNLSRKFSSREEFKNYLVCHSDMCIKDIFSFSIDDFRNEYPEVIDNETLSKILDNFALSYGELKENNFEHFFLNNPIWTKPLVKHDVSTYIWPIPGLLYHSNFDMIELIITNDLKLKEKYEKARSDYLEEAIQFEFLKGFPNAKIYKGSSWTDEIEKKEFENDLLILIDSYAIAIEAKSGKITDPAKRGASERLKRDIQKLIIEPSIQACRFASFLERNLGKVIVLKNGKADDLELDLTKIKKVLTYSVTLDLFGPIGTNLVELFNAGFIKEKSDLSPCMSLADLEIITDLLETSCEKIHYFSRRFEMEKNAKFTADELDLLVFYLETGFNIGESEINGLQLMIYGVSSKLDYYYLSKYHNPDEKVNKPQPRRTKWWNSIINKLEIRKIPRWTEFSYMLLNVSFEDQQQFESMFFEVVEIVKEEWNKPEHKNSVVLYNSFRRNDVIIVYVYKNIDKETRNKRIENLVMQSFDEEDRCRRALVLAINIDEAIYPYSLLAVLDRNE